MWVLYGFGQKWGVVPQWTKAIMHPGAFMDHEGPTAHFCPSSQRPPNNPYLGKTGLLGLYRAVNFNTVKTVKFCAAKITPPKLLLWIIFNFGYSLI